MLFGRAGARCASSRLGAKTFLAGLPAMMRETDHAQIGVLGAAALKERDDAVDRDAVVRSTNAGARGPLTATVILTLDPSPDAGPIALMLLVRAW